MKKRGAWDPRGSNLASVLDVDDESWFEFWHTHPDGAGRGNATAGARRHYLRKVRATYLDVLARLRTWQKPHQTWALIDKEDSGQDSVYVHSPNPNRDNFPYAFDDVEWGDDIPDWISRVFSPELFELGRSAKDGATYYWIRKHDT